MMKQTKGLLLLITLLCIFITGCGDDSSSSDSGGNINEFQVLKAPGYYGDLRMMPNGVFLVRNKIAENKVDNAGLVYKVEFNENNKPNKITAMQGGIPMSVDWQDTLSNKFHFSAVSIEYNEKQTRYNFRNSRMAADTGYYDAFSIGYKLDDSGKNYTVAYLYNKDGDQSTALRGYSQMFFKYDDSGKLINIGFADDGGSRVTNSDKEYELRLKYDKQSVFPIEIANYGKDGSLMADSTGIAKTTFKFDDKGRVVEVRHYGSDDMLKDKNSPNLAFDKVITSISAGAITRYKYTDNSERIEFLGKDEQAEGIKAWSNIAAFEIKYTPEGWISSVASFATDDSPTPLSKEMFGDNVVKIEISHDAYGNRDTMKFYGKDDNAVTASILGAAEVRYKYDEKRRLTGESYYGTGGDPIEINRRGFNYHSYTYEYNDDDDITLSIYYDKSGKEVSRENTSTNANVASTPVNNHPPTNNPPASNAAPPPPPAVEEPVGIHWIKDDSTGVYLWNPEPKEDESISWSGSYIQDGNYRYANGAGTVTWYRNGRVIQVDNGAFEHGRHNGQFSHKFPSGRVIYSNWDHGKEIG